MNRKRYVACSLAVVRCLALLDGGGSRSEDTSETEEQTDTSSGTSSSAEEAQPVFEESGYRAGLVLAVDGTQVTVQYDTPLDETAEKEITEPSDFVL